MFESPKSCRRVNTHIKKIYILRTMYITSPQHFMKRQVELLTVTALLFCPSPGRISCCGEMGHGWKNLSTLHLFHQAQVDAPKAIYALSFACAQRKGKYTPKTGQHAEKPSESSFAAAPYYKHCRAAADTSQVIPALQFGGESRATPFAVNNSAGCDLTQLPGCRRPGAAVEVPAAHGSC